MSCADGRISDRSANRMGTAPSQRAARAIGRLAGRTPPTQIGTRGRWTGTGVNRTGSTV